MRIVDRKKEWRVHITTKPFYKYDLMNNYYLCSFADYIFINKNYWDESVDFKFSDVHKCVKEKIEKLKQVQDLKDTDNNQNANATKTNENKI